MYTRNGSLRVSPAGDLLAAEDRPVLDINSRPIRVDPARPIEIDRSGETEPIRTSEHHVRGSLSRGELGPGALGTTHADRQRHRGPAGNGEHERKHRPCAPVSTPQRPQPKTHRVHVVTRTRPPPTADSIAET